MRIARGITSSVFVLLLAGAACGGGGGQVAAKRGPPLHTRKAGAPMPVPRQPIEVSVTPRAQGGALEVAVEVVARGHQEGEPFEDPERWAIEVRDAGGNELPRIMNGPKRVERAPVGIEDGTQWDVTVTHSVFFRLPEHVDRVAVRVAIEGASPVEIRSELR